MVSVGGRDVCWWEWSVIVAGFEPGGEAGRTGREEGMKGNREGDVAVRSTDPRRGDTSSFLPLTRGDNCDFNPNNQTRRLETSFIMSGENLV